MPSSSLFSFYWLSLPNFDVMGFFILVFFYVLVFSVRRLFFPKERQKGSGAQMTREVERNKQEWEEEISYSGYII